MSLISILQKKLDQRKSEGAYRSLKLATINSIDFTSNDYLGLAKSKTLSDNITQRFHQHSNTSINGSSGSRLLGGNSLEAQKLEEYEDFTLEYY